MRSYAELLEASGYGGRPQDFEDLIRVLDGEIRLITPTDPEGVAGAGWRVAGEAIVDVTTSSPGTRHAPPATRYYQLTHDYQVPSLRDWLTHKQKETRRGRAGLRLGERAALWTAKPESRHLPAWWEWLTIRLLTRKKDWTHSQRKMMRQAARYHTARGFALAGVLALAGWGSYQAHGTLKASALKERLLDANTKEVPNIVKDMAPYRRWLDPLLQAAYQDAKANHKPGRALHASLALLPTDPGQVGYLYGRLLHAPPRDVSVLRDALLPHKLELLDKLWSVVEQPVRGKESQRLRAASALATYDPDDSRWEEAGGPVFEQLVSENTFFMALWMEGLRPVRTKLLPCLVGVFKDRIEKRTSARTLATNILADYAADQTQVLADLLMDSDEEQFAVIYPKLREHGERGSLHLLTGEIDRKL